MADTPHAPTVPNTPLTRPRKDEQSPTDRDPLSLGACNFTNLSVGGNAPRCGCRRFWDRSLGSQDAALDAAAPRAASGWCMCEHHACFHDFRPPESSSSRSLGGFLVRPSQEASSTTVLEATKQTRQPLQDQTLDLAPAGSELPDTLRWSGIVRPGSSLGSLPAIPSQCLLPSQTGSTSGSSQAKYNRPFAGRGMQTLDQISRILEDAPGPENGPSTETGRPTRIYKDSIGREFLQSLTDIASPRPSNHDTAEFDKTVATIQDALERFEDKSATPEAALVVDDEAQHLVLSHNEPHLLPQLRSIVNCVASYPLTIKNHEQRLSFLENASFANPGLEDVQETVENLDTRVIELSERMDDVEKAQAALNEVSSAGSILGGGSFASAVSHGSALVPAADHAELSSRFQALEDKLWKLQAIIQPSHGRPWEVEVVLLPFGSRLMGLWSPQAFFTQHTMTDDVDDWILAHDTKWATAGSSPTHAALYQEPWLMPRACNLHSRISARLKSRGFIRTIQVNGPDYRDVQAAVMAAFGDLLDTLVKDPFTHHGTERVIPSSLDRYMGLEASWIPLRKIHKDSCLRFLNPAEMATPALWNVPFLASSVVMRGAGVRRLYLTHRDSYVQHLGDTTDWTWRKLRQLPRFYEANLSITHTPEADAQEACWAWDERLDPPISLSSSFTSHHSLSIRPLSQGETAPVSPSDHFSSAAVSRNASTPTAFERSSRPLVRPKERKPSALHTRTKSLSSIAPVLPFQPRGKRRIASFEQESPTRSPLALKRLRISRSPSRSREAPHWSIGPPSPYTAAGTATEDVYDRKRPTTPFAYATPHSNAPYFELPRAQGAMPNDPDDEGSLTDRSSSGGGYEQNALSDYHGEATPGEVDDWQGLDDEAGLGLGLYDSGPDDKVVLGLRALPEARDGQDDEFFNHVDDVDNESDDSSQPSEYPSGQQQRQQVKSFFTTRGGSHGADQSGAGFQIHVDEDEDVGMR